MLPPTEVRRFACPAELEHVELSLPDQPPHAVTLEPCGAADEEHAFTIGDRPVILRRVHCVIHDGLLRGNDPTWQLSRQARAALLWRAFKRYSELVGLKRLSGGLSGSDVLVFRPRLRAPVFDLTPPMASAGPADALAGSWGSPLLVKTGPADTLRQEWQRSETFLHDRQSPFLARNEELLNVLPVGPPPDEREQRRGPQATMISSFLGGDVVQAEPLDKLIRGTRDADRALGAIGATVGHLSAWHTNPVQLPLAQWPRAFRFANSLPPPEWPTSEPAAPWLAFGWYNFRKAKQGEKAGWDLPRPDGGVSCGRAEFAGGVGWDIPFGKTDHLERHLLGSPEKRDGLLYRLAELPALFSLVHGDLNPRNVLCDGGKVWLIDFHHVGVGPVLADLARLEANLRLWCIDLGPAGEGPAAAHGLERLLLDHFHGSDSSLEPVRRFARPLGADPDDLEKIARCVIHIRRLARRWCVPGFADGRDYLAALYLTVLGLLPYAGQGHTGPSNERWAVELCWVLEETLDRLLSRPTFDRNQRPCDPLRYVSAEFLRAPDAPRRVDYLCSTADGREALQPVVALRGVLQGSYHHLDAYQHTLSVLAYLEAILDNPVGGLLNPSELDAMVSARLRGYGLDLPPPVSIQQAPSVIDTHWFEPRREKVETFLQDTLTDEVQLLLKWCALLHDVGKPGTRTAVDRSGGPEVQFLGHEKYGVALLRSRLAAWFPGGDPEKRSVNPCRLADLIRNHHRSHQLVGDGFLRNPIRAAELRDLLRGESRRGMLGWLNNHAEQGCEEFRPDLPLLLLHGYADRLSARGVRQGGTVGGWAAVTLALLTCLACREELVRAEAGRTAVRTSGPRRPGGMPPN